MKKKIFALVLAFAMTLSLVACGGSSSDTATDDTGETSAATVADESTPEGEEEPEEEEAEPLDLTGTWEYEEDEIAATAVIDEDSIVVYLYTLGSMWTYWAGSYEAPTDAAEEYTWTSTKDASLIDDDTLTAPADTLEFTYQGGALTCVFDLDTGDEAVDLIFNRADGDAGEAAETSTGDLAVTPATIYDNYDITITAELYHHDDSQDYIQLTTENNSDMDIEIQGFDFVVNGESVEDSYYSFLHQEVSAGETLGDSVYDGIYFEADTLPGGVDEISTLSFTLHIEDCSDYHTVDEVTVDLTVE